jgi:hypothetical protein
MDELELQAARDLQAQLLQLLPLSVAEVKVEEFAGVRVKCVAFSGRRSCRTGCSLYLIYGASNRDPAFQTHFEESGALIAFGTTESMADTASAVAQWLQGVHLDRLYDQFAFIDKAKRYLIEMEESVRHEISCLGDSVQVELKEDRGVWYWLWFRSEKRSAMVDGHFKMAKFFWDDCLLFQFEVRNYADFVPVVNRWLCENALPSSMRSDFPWLEIGELADYYEAGNPVEGEFLQSWDETEAWVNGQYFPRGTGAPKLIAELRAAGYDRKLRAGTEHGRGPIFSRSRRHGLRSGQANIFVDCLSGQDIMDIWVSIPEQRRKDETHGIRPFLSRIPSYLPFKFPLKSRKITGAPVGLSGQFAEAINQLCELEID